MLGSFRNLATIKKPSRVKTKIKTPQRKLKILVFARFANRSGGAAVYTEGLAIHLAKLGHQVHVFCHVASPEVHAVCDVSEFADQDYSQLCFVWRFRSLFYQRSCRQFLRQQSDLSSDVIINSLPLSTRDLKRIFQNVPLVYLPHSRIAPIEATAQTSNSWLQHNFNRRMYSHWEKWSIINAATTVRFTADNEQSLREFYRLPQEADFEIIPAPVEQFKIGEKTQVNRPVKLAVVSRLVASKNLAWLLRTLADLKNDHWQLVVAGDGPQRESLQLQCRELNIEDQVTLLGFCEDVSSVYEAADVHVFPSLRESCGLVILEAMAFSVPTIAFRPDGQQIQTASHKIIQHGENGLLANNENEFRRLLADCIEHPERLLPLGKNGQEKANAHHRWSGVANVWESVLEKVVASH